MGESCKSQPTENVLKGSKNTFLHVPHVKVYNETNRWYSSAFILYIIKIHFSWQLFAVPQFSYCGGVEIRFQLH